MKDKQEHIASPDTESSRQVLWNAFRKGLREGWIDYWQFLTGFWRVMTLREPAWPPGMNSNMVLFATVVALIVILVTVILGGQA